MTDIQAGRKVRITFEGYPGEFKILGNSTYLKVSGNGCTAEIDVDAPGVIVETLPYDRPSWWDKAYPGTVVEPLSGKCQRAIKRDFRGICPPANAQTHPWMWADGTPATEDDVLQWGKFRMVLLGKEIVSHS